MRRLKVKIAKNRFAKKHLLALMVVGLLSIPAVVYAGWWPERPTFDYNNPSDRVGSLTGPVFNSFINTPSYGDERAFFDVHKASEPDSAPFHNLQEDVHPGDELILRTYVHNNANPSIGEKGTAKNTRVSIFLPTGTETSLRSTSFISADNSVPQTVSDTLDIQGPGPFSLAYVPGSAVAYTNAVPGGYGLNDSIVTNEGALIGYTEPNGNVPGCFEYEAVVAIRVVVNGPKLGFDKLVRHEGESNWVKEIDAQPGDKVEWLLDYKNTGTSVLNDTTLRDQLPPHVTLVPGTVVWIDPNNPNGHVLPDGDLFTSGGVDFGSYAPNGGGYVMFTVTINNDFSECLTTIRNTAFAKASKVPETNSQAAVVIDTCAPTPPPPQPPTPPPAPPVTPPAGALPSTGIGGMLAGFFGTGALGMSIRSWLGSRRSLRSSLLGNK